MTTVAKFVVWFSEVDKNDGDRVGGKGANLGEMTKAGIPVPNGFVVTAQAYFHFIAASKLKDKIHAVLDNLDYTDNQKLNRAAHKVSDLILHAKMPDAIAQAILKAYAKMESLLGSDLLVAVRSSATAEDLPGASFAGQQETYLNIRGDANVVFHVRKAWASLFTPRAMFYRNEKNFDHFKVGIAVPVQKMVQSEQSGIMFTLDPVTNDKKKIVIEAIYGLGELIVQGAETPDHYEVEKQTGKILMKTVSHQEKMMVWQKGKTVLRTVPPKSDGRQKISDSVIETLYHLGKKLEHHYYFPQDIEWAVEKGKVFITQTRPVTTIKEKTSPERLASRQEIKEPKLPLLLTGDPASPGIGCGPVKVVKSARELRKIMPGDILVAPRTDPDYVPAMRKVAAIVTEQGGRTSHAAIVSRELGIPAVVGAKNAIKTLKDKQVVTVDGGQGKIYKGGNKAGSMQFAVGSSTTPSNASFSTNSQKTATKVYVNLASPARVEEISQMHVDGVGLLRAEFMIADIGTHPKQLIHDHKQHVFINTLSDKLTEFCRNFGNRPVVYRATDFKTNEYRGLKGGKTYEPIEANPMMGYRGAYRYVSDSRVFELELEAIKHVRNKKGFKNLWLMIPYVHTPAEMREVKKIVAASNLHRGGSFKLWMMVEIPSNVILIDEFLEIGIDGVSIGSNDLTMLTMGVDRDNSEVASVFDERNPALAWSFERVIKACHKHGVTSSMCGQAPSDYPELVEKLVGWGITSVSVNPDMVGNVRQTVFDAERKLVRSKQ